MREETCFKVFFVSFGIGMLVFLLTMSAAIGITAYKAATDNLPTAKSRADVNLSVETKRP